MERGVCMIRSHSKTVILQNYSTSAKLYLLDSRGRNTAALIEVDILSKEKKVLAFDEKSDLRKIGINPQTLEPESACFCFERNRWVFFENFEQKPLSLLKSLEHNCSGEVEIIQRNSTDQLWLLKMETQSATQFYIYNKDNDKLVFLGAKQKNFESKPIIIESKDNFPLVCYLTIPPRINNLPLPMILLVHSGPNYPDQLLQHQSFAAEGYAVMSVNFRGSCGFGKNFLNASVGEWGRKMQEDLIDATVWAIKENIADSKKIGIYGHFYGGYATFIHRFLPVGSLFADHQT